MFLGVPHDVFYGVSVSCERLNSSLSVSCLVRVSVFKFGDLGEKDIKLRYPPFSYL